MGTLGESGFVDCSAIMRCAVYALVRKGEVVYIGLSKSAHARLSTHCRTRARGAKVTGLYDNRGMTGINFDEVWVRPCMLGELEKIEKEMILRYRPKYNSKYLDRPAPQPDMALMKLIEDSFPLLPPCPEPRQSAFRRR